MSAEYAATLDGIRLAVEWACEQLGVARADAGLDEATAVRKQVSLGDEAHKAAVREECAAHPDMRLVRALHQIANAFAARWRALRQIEHDWGEQSLEWYVSEAERERDEMVRLVRELTEAKAAE